MIMLVLCCILIVLEDQSKFILKWLQVQLNIKCSIVYVGRFIYLKVFFLFISNSTFFIFQDMYLLKLTEEV